MKSLPIIILTALVVGCAEPERGANDVKPRTNNDTTTAVTHGVTIDFDTTMVCDTIQL